MTTPICRECAHLNVLGPTWPARRANCYCEHKDARARRMEAMPGRMPGFIGFTSSKDLAPAIKTSPRWCPLREGSDHEAHL